MLKFTKIKFRKPISVSAAYSCFFAVHWNMHSSFLSNFLCSTSQRSGIQMIKVNNWISLNTIVG
jgi:hypothetical protein